MGAGTVSEGGGMDTSKVVDVPSERIASPGEDNVTIVDGLSPVNGATMQSERTASQRTCGRRLKLCRYIGFTRGEVISLSPPFADGAECGSSRYWLVSELGS